MTGRLAWLVALLALAVPGLAEAQAGAIAGRVTDSTRSEPLSGAQVAVRDAAGRRIGSAVTTSDGSYRVGGLDAGRYTVLVSFIPFAPKSFEGVAVQAGGTTTVDAALIPSTLQLAELVVTTVSRVPEKITEAPAAISVIPSVQVQERPALTVTDHLQTVPGVAVSTGGLVQSNIVSRGFNNIFSGSLLTLIDNRYASVPSLRVNVPAFFPVTNEDVERIEFVLGPGAALYGPNVSQGVLHIITKSPIDAPGTTLALEGGFRSKTPGAVAGSDEMEGLTRFSFRHATRVSAKVGFKVSGEYLVGTDWRYADPGDTLSPSRTQGGSKRSCGQATYGCRDFDLEKWSGEARVDIKPNQDTEWITSYGRSQAKSLIELTGIGAGQARDWVFQHVQTRFRWKEFFAQGFVNVSDAGETFLLRDGNALVDKSRQWAGQVQHGFAIGGRQTFVYGADAIYTDARTEGTINGVNEDDDEIKEVGAYVHSVTRLSDKVDAVAALRVDKNSRLESAVFSPRVALVLKPSEEHNLRLTYNRAFSTPRNTDLFLDIQAGRIALTPTIGYTIRALGVPKGGFQFRANGGCTGGVGGGLCMRSPFAPPGLLPASANLLWSAAVAAVLPGVQAKNPQLAALLALVAPPSAGQVGTALRRLNTTTQSFVDIDPNDVTDIETLKPSIANTIEFGYRYDKARKASFSFSGFFERRENFIGPLIVESPTVFLDPATLQAYLGAQLGALGLPAAAIPSALQALVPGMAQIPLATVVPNSAGGGNRDDLVARPDIFLTYRNFGTVDLFGADLAFDYFFTDRFSMSATYSWVNKDFFAADEIEGPSPIALNAPKNRGSLTLRYRNDIAGWGAEARVRAAQGFPVNSGVYISPQRADGSFEPTESYGIVDVQGSWRPPIGVRNMLIALSVQNVFNTGYATFVGVPQIGRLVLSKVSYTF